MAFAKHFGCARFAYNYALSLKIKTWETVSRIGRFEPSSKLCPCGTLNQSLKLSDRDWTCKSCGTTHDRDVLAANNIKRMALHPKQSLRQEMPESTPVEIVNRRSTKQEFKCLKI